MTMYPLEIEHVTKRYGHEVVGMIGAGRGALIRNLGGAVTVVMLALFVIPPLAVLLVSDAASWIPPTLFAVISGVSTEVGLWAALMTVAQR